MAAQHTFLALVLCVLGVASAPQGFAQAINAPPSSNRSPVSQAVGNFEDAELSGGVKQVAWPSIPWPTITMPKITMPKLPPLWPSNTNGGSPALLSPFVAGYAKVSAGARKTWEGTKDLFSVFQPQGDSRTTSRRALKPKTSFWQRLTTRKQEPKVPQTVGEFMRQPRLK